MKVLFWDRSGYVLFYKRLEPGIFHLPAEASKCLEIDAPPLTLILEGLDLSGARQSKRFHAPAAVR